MSSAEPKRSSTGGRSNKRKSSNKTSSRDDSLDDSGLTGDSLAAAPSLTRDISKGMNPTSILTGFYGTKGEKIRHIVHEGALRLPAQALELMATSLDPLDRFELPGLDSIIRPSRDFSNKSITVTEIYGMNIPADPVNMQPERFQCYARNRSMPIERKPEAERIRGGGGGGGGGEETETNESTLEKPSEATATDVPMSDAITTATMEPATTASDATADKAPSSSAAAAPEKEDTQPSNITSNSTTASNLEVESLKPEVVPLTKPPQAQWEQHAPEGKTAPSTITLPDWYTPDRISDLEQSMLPEWFDESAAHRTRASYLDTRERIVKMSNKLDTRHVTFTLIRRSIPGDIGSLMRLYNFLTSNGLINAQVGNESAPTPVLLQESKAKYRWSEPLQHELLYAVVEESRKRRRKGPSVIEFEPIIDWQAVADAVGHGVTSAECERQFLALPIPEDATKERSITPDASMSEADNAKLKSSSEDDAKSRLHLRTAILQDIIDQCDPKMVHAVTQVALGSSDASTDVSLSSAQRAAIVGLVASQAAAEARSRENKVSRIMAEIVDVRMKKLENRLALLDDVEDLLDNERVALELERRDLYTARCRHWFGGP
jgi:SWI/SNF related-matrix-associated actin-dependent regulator of chromatin subfamily C